MDVKNSDGSTRNCCCKEGSKAERLSFQLFIFCLTFANYAVLHASRLLWGQATPTLEKDYNFSTQLISNINACYLSVYAFGGIFSGHIADKFRKDWYLFITFSLIGSEVILLGSLYYFSHQYEWVFFLIKIIDGIIQSVGWATNLAVLSNWFPKKGRGLLIGLWASNANVGDIIG